MHVSLHQHHTVVLLHIKHIKVHHQDLYLILLYRHRHHSLVHLPIYLSRNSHIYSSIRDPVYHSPASDPSLQQMHPQQMVHRPVGPDVPMSASPQVVPLQPSQLAAGQRFPMQGRPMIRPNLQPHPTAGQSPYGHGVPAVHSPHYHGAAP